MQATDCMQKVGTGNMSMPEREKGSNYIVPSPETAPMLSDPSSKWTSVSVTEGLTKETNDQLHVV